MIRTYRKYVATVDWIDPKGNSLESRKTVMNLFNVSDWTSVDNAYSGFNDTHKRTAVHVSNETCYLRVSFEEFDAIMTKFLADYNLLDEDSMSNKKKLTAKQTYRGMMDFRFHAFPNKLVCNSYPAGLNPTDFETAVANVLHSQITPYN